MNSNKKLLGSRLVPAWLAIPLTAFIVASPIAMAVAMTHDLHWRDYVLPAAVGGVLLLIMVYWLFYMRLVERELQRERNLLRTLIDALPDRIYAKDVHGRKTLSNLADWHASGIARLEDFLGRTDLENYPPALAAKYWVDDQSVLQTGQPILNREEPALDADGNIVWTLATKVPVRDPDGRLTGLVGISRDVTAYKQSLDAQRAAEERYRKIFEESVEGIYQTTPDGSIVTVNPALAHMLGYDSPQELMARMRDIDAQLYVDRSRRGEFRRRIESAGVIAGFESEIYRKDGTTIWISEQGRTVCDDNGIVLYYEGTMIDITERKRAEAAQRKAEEKYRSFFENSVAGIFQTTVEGRYLAANPALAAIFGYDSPGDLMSCITDLRHQLYAHPEDRLKFGQLMAAEGRVAGFEAEALRKDGSTRWIVMNALLVRDAAGQPANYEGTVVDITARKQIEHAQQESHRKQVAWINQLEQRTRDMSLLNEMSDLIQCCPTADEAYNVIQQQIQWLFAQDSGALYILNSSRNIVEARAAWGAPFDDPSAFHPADCWAYRRGQLHTVESIWAADPNMEQPLLVCDHVKRPLPEAFICAPLIAQGETLGMLHLRHQSPSNDLSSQSVGTCYSEASRQFTRMVAESLALSISNLKLRESLRQQSIRDALTGLFNRRYMEESLEREVARSARAERPLSVIMLDIDHFKSFNDTSGHGTGDAVLRALGPLIRSQVREADIACRYGGEEFVLIMPDASLEIAAQRAECIRAAVSSLEVQYAGQLLGSVTVSLGVAAFPAHGRTGESIVQVADAALYQAKQAGRNRVSVAKI